MKIVIQRALQASVAVQGKVVDEIAKGLLLFVGIEKGDSEETVQKLADKISLLRIFSDDQGKMNLNIQDAGGALLSVSQFTLCADLKKGNRPGFDQAARPERAQALWRTFNDCLRTKGLSVSEGVFGADMKVSLVNDGPVTFVLSSEPDERPPL